MAHEISNFIQNFLEKHQGRTFHVLEFKIDYCDSKEITDQYGVNTIVPYLNIYLGNLEQGLSVTETMKQAEKFDNFDFYYDLIENADESEFDLELTRILKPGIKTTRLDYNEFLSLLQEALKECLPLTRRINTIFVHCVDDFEILYLKESDALIQKVHS